MFVPLADFPNTSAVAIYTFLVVQVQPVVPSSDCAGFFVTAIAGTNQPVFSMVPSCPLPDFAWLLLKAGQHPGCLLKGDRAYPILSVHPMAEAMRDTYTWLLGEFPRLQYRSLLRS